MWYPGAVRRPVARLNPGGSIAQQITPRRAIFHTAVSGARSLFDYFNQPGNPCSTWYVAADGYCEQYVDTNYRAPAQLEGNHDCLSWETQDIDGPFPAWSGSDVPAWTSAQVERLADIAAWVNREHGIPLMLLPDSKGGRTGYGYHRQGINPWRVPSGELWSNATGKACPGDRRIAQIPQILAAAQGDDVPLTYEEIEALAKRTAEHVWGIASGGYQIGQNTYRTQTMVATLTDDEEQIKAAITAAAVDPAVLATQLAPLLADQNVVVNIDDAGLAAIAVAVADEQARRQQA